MVDRDLAQSDLGSAPVGERTSGKIRQRRQGGVLELILSHPGKRNAVNRAMLDALVSALVAAEADPAIRVVLLTGESDAFCAGADIGGDILDRVGEMKERMRYGINRLVSLMRASRLPIVVAVNGAAAGGGVGLALAGDIVIAARSAYFLQSFVKIGLSVDCGISMLVQRAIGAPRARALAMLGEKLDAEDAARFGLIWRVTPDESLMEDARSVAQRLENSPPLAIAWIKQALETGWTGAFDEGLAREIDWQAQAFLTDDLREGITAFQESRPAVFKGA